MLSGRIFKTSLVASLLAAIFASLYLTQILSPLRLNTDAYRFLSLAVSACEGHGFLVDGQPDVFPEGYPVLLGGLIRLGLGTTVWINALSVFCLLAGCAAFHRLLRLDAEIGPATRTLLATFPLASWVCVKHAPLPLSDDPYFGLSLAALLLLGLAWHTVGSKAVGWLMFALIVALAAFRVRTVGLSLIATVAATAALHPAARASITRHLPKSKTARAVLAAAGALVLAIGGFAIWKHQTALAVQADAPAYVRQQADGAAAGFAKMLGFTVQAHTRELGEILLNLPETRFPTLRPAFLVAGILTLALALAGLPRLARRFPPLGIYAVCYSGIIFVWPFYDPRFWMPLIPVLTLSVWFALQGWRDRSWLNCATCFYVTAFLVLGLVALFFSTRLTFAGASFPERYGDGSKRDSYRVAFGQSPSDPAAVDDRLVALLRRFEPRARPSQPPP